MTTPANATPADRSQRATGAQHARFSIDRVKPWIESVQALMTVLAFIVGGIWTYRIFVMQRESHAHAVIAATVSRVALTDKVNLIQVILRIDNTGHELITLKGGTVWLQIVLPITGCGAHESCATDELNAALKSDAREQDRFTWPVVQRRDAKWAARRIEPGEPEFADFEFVLPAWVRVVRVYGFIPNTTESPRGGEAIGWHVAKLYDLRQPDALTEKP